MTPSRRKASLSRALPRRALLKVAGILGLSLALANCAGTQMTGGGQSSESKYGVKASPRVVAEGETVPKGGGRALIGKPYVVGGRTYVPTASHYRKEGWASWYGTAFHGRLTANGEVFDRGSVAAAHPTMPLPSYVRVTNVLNRRSMIVRVNDRGPYEQNRIIDVSERVAEALDFRRRGTARVRIEYVGKASLRGSDDEKLLATLTTDGAPAPFGGRRTMLADLKDEPAPRAPAVRMAEADPPARPVVAEAPVRMPSGRDEIADAEPASMGRTQVASAEGAAEAGVEDEDRLDHPLPPSRPTAFAAIRVASADAPAAPVSRPVAQPGSPAASTDLLPPQRPRFADIY